MDSLINDAAELGVKLEFEQAEQIYRYGELLKKWNKGMNLVSRQDIQRLQPRHLLDSLAAVPHLPSGSVLDIGTGPGLPGIPLAIACPDVVFTLWERMTRRVRFLLLVCRELGLQNVVAQACDFEKLGAEHQAQQFDAVVARAVAPIEQLWPKMQPHLTPRGLLIVYSHVAGKGEPEESDAMIKTPSPLPGLKEYAYTVPGLEQTHHLQVISKDTVGETPVVIG